MTQMSKTKIKPRFKDKRKENARLEAMILARGISYFSQSDDMTNALVPHFKRSEIIKGLKQEGINFEVIHADFNNNLNPMMFVLTNLINADLIPDKLDIKYTSGDVYESFSLSEIKTNLLKNQHSFRELNKIRNYAKNIGTKVLPSLLSEESLEFIAQCQDMERVEKNLNQINSSANSFLELKMLNREYFDAKLLLYLAGEKINPFKLRDKHLQQKGYPVEYVNGKLTWKDQYANIFDDPTIHISISIAPEIFGTIPNKNYHIQTGRFDHSHPNYGSRTLSGLCLSDRPGLFQRMCEEDYSISKRVMLIKPLFFIEANNYVLPSSPAKAREVLRKISKYVRIKERRY